jgi:hypothetical protein
MQMVNTLVQRPTPILLKVIEFMISRPKFVNSMSVTLTSVPVYFPNTLVYLSPPWTLNSVNFVSF